MLNSPFGRGVLFALGLIVAAGLLLQRALRGARRAGRAERAGEIAEERVRAAQETRRRIEHADISNGDAVDDGEWLFRRGQRPD